MWLFKKKKEAVQVITPEESARINKLLAEEDAYEESAYAMTSKELTSELQACFARLKKFSNSGLFVTRKDAEDEEKVREQVKCLLSLHKERGLPTPNNIYLTKNGKIVEPESGVKATRGLTTGRFY